MAKLPTNMEKLRKVAELNAKIARKEAIRAERDRALLEAAKAETLKAELEARTKARIEKIKRSGNTESAPISNNKNNYTIKVNMFKTISRTAAALILAISLGLMATGCGGDKTPAGKTTVALTAPSISFTDETDTVVLDGDNNTKEIIVNISGGGQNIQSQRFTANGSGDVTIQLENATVGSIEIKAKAAGYETDTKTFTESSEASKTVTNTVQVSKTAPEAISGFVYNDTTKKISFNKPADAQAVLTVQVNNQTITMTSAAGNKLEGSVEGKVVNGAGNTIVVTVAETDTHLAGTVLNETFTATVSVDPGKTAPEAISGFVYNDTTKKISFNKPADTQAVLTVKVNGQNITMTPIAGNKLEGSVEGKVVNGAGNTIVVTVAETDTHNAGTVLNETFTATVSVPQTQLAQPSAANITTVTDYNKAIFNITNVDAAATGLKYGATTMPLTGYNAGDLKLENVGGGTYKLTISGLTAGAFNGNITAVSTNPSYSESAARSLTATVYADPAASYAISASYVDAGNLIKVKVPTDDNWNHIEITNLRFDGTVASSADKNLPDISRTKGSFDAGAVEADGGKIGDYVYIGIGNNAPYNGTIVGQASIYTTSAAGSIIGTPVAITGGTNTEVFTDPSIVAGETTNNKLVFNVDLLPAGHSQSGNETFELALTPVSGSPIELTLNGTNKGTGTNQFWTVESGKVTIDLDKVPGIATDDETYSVEFKQNAVTNVKGASGYEYGTAEFEVDKTPVGKYSFVAIAEAKYDSVAVVSNFGGIPIKGISEDGAKKALKEKLGTVKIDNKLIDIDAITDINIVKVYGSAANIDVRDLTNNFSGTVIANITVTTGGGPKTVLARIPFNYVSSHGSNPDPSGAELAMKLLFEEMDVADNTIEIASQKATFDTMMYWNIKSAKLSKTAGLASDLSIYSPGIDTNTFGDYVIFMNDIDNLKTTFTNEHIIFVKPYDNGVGTVAYRLYEMTLEGDHDILAGLYGVAPGPKLGQRIVYAAIEYAYGASFAEEPLMGPEGSAISDINKVKRFDYSGFNLNKSFRANINEYDASRDILRELEPNDFKPSAEPTL